MSNFIQQEVVAEALLERELSNIHYKEKRNVLKPNTAKMLRSLLASSNHRNLANTFREYKICENFTLESFLLGYTGYQKIEQLLFLAACCPQLAIESLELCLKCLVEETSNTGLYKSVFDAYFEVRTDFGLARVEKNISWITETQQGFSSSIDQLRDELRNSRSNGVKESIRLTLLALGDKYVDGGSFPEASASYLKSREACVNEAQSIETWLRCLKVASADFNNYTLSNATNMLGALPISPKDKSTFSKFKAANGLSKFKSCNHVQSVHQFLEIDFSSLSYVSEILPPTVMVAMVVLSSLAYFDRKSIQSQVLGNQQFKRFLELEPLLRELIKSLLKSNYSALMASLEERRGYFLRSIFLHEQVQPLFEAIKRRAILDYFKPFKSASLSLAAEEFSTTINDIQNEICGLISSGHLSARLDFEHKVLWTKKTDPRSQVHQKVQKLGKIYQREVRTTIGLMRLQQAKLN